LFRISPRRKEKSPRKEISPLTISAYSENTNKTLLSVLQSLVIVSTYYPDAVLVNTLFQRPNEWQLYAKFDCVVKTGEKTVDTFQIDWAIIRRVDKISSNLSREDAIPRA
jgi:hypothetical protein